MQIQYAVHSENTQAQHFMLQAYAKIIFKKKFPLINLH